MSALCLQPGTGETLVEPTSFLPPETNTFLNTVVHAGLWDPPAPLLTESTSREVEHGLLLICPLNKSLIVEELEIVEVEILWEFMPGLTAMVSLMKPVTTTKRPTKIALPSTHVDPANLMDLVIPLPLKSFTWLETMDKSAVLIK